MFVDLLLQVDVQQHRTADPSSKKEVLYYCLAARNTWSHQRRRRRERKRQGITGFECVPFYRIECSATKHYNGGRGWGSGGEAKLLCMLLLSEEPLKDRMVLLQDFVT